MSPEAMRAALECPDGKRWNDRELELLDVLPGLIINFHEIKLTGGIARMILPGANRLE
jgi:hypothetical protein